jgi:hypothetical protein
MPKADYYNAAVCVRGHVASEGVEFSQPGKFCEQCGAEVITSCPKCSTAIRGPWRGGISTRAFTPPSFCLQCGAPFPWTAAKISAARELADEIDDLSSEDRGKLKEAISDIATAGPRTELGAARIKKMLGNATTGLGQALWKISVEVASEAAKKIMLGG